VWVQSQWQFCLKRLSLEVGKGRVNWGILSVWFKNKFQVQELLKYQLQSFQKTQVQLDKHHLINLIAISNFLYWVEKLELEGRPLLKLTLQRSCHQRHAQGVLLSNKVWSALALVNCPSFRQWWGAVKH
jgi:hypothetical protein